MSTHSVNFGGVVSRQPDGDAGSALHSVFHQPIALNMFQSVGMGIGSAVGSCTSISGTTGEPLPGNAKSDGTLPVGSGFGKSSYICRYIVPNKQKTPLSFK